MSCIYTLAMRDLVSEKWIYLPYDILESLLFRLFHDIHYTDLVYQSIIDIVTNLNTLISVKSTFSPWFLSKMRHHSQKRDITPYCMPRWSEIITEKIASAKEGSRYPNNARISQSSNLTYHCLYL